MNNQQTLQIYQILLFLSQYFNLMNLDLRTYQASRNRVLHWERESTTSDAFQFSTTQVPNFKIRQNSSTVLAIFYLCEPLPQCGRHARWQNLGPRIRTSRSSDRLRGGTHRGSASCVRRLAPHHSTPARRGWRTDYKWLSCRASRLASSPSSEACKHLTFPPSEPCLICRQSLLARRIK